MNAPSISGSASLGRRERQRATTRDAIATAALELFEEKGFTATTVDEIADRADVARRTFFRYFTTKEAVLLPDPAEYESRLLAVLDRLDPPVTMSQILNAFVAAATTIEEDATLHRRRAVVMASSDIRVDEVALGAFLTVRDAVVAHLAARAGLAEADPRLQLGVSLALFSFAHAYVRWAEHDAEGDLVAILEETVGLVQGLVTDTVVMGRPQA